MHKPKVDAIFAALDRSQVSIADLAVLAKVSRETLYRWKNGNNITDRLRLDLVYTIASKLNTAVDRDALPLTGHRKPQERRELLRDIIKKTTSK